jgi:hypothetical protein
MDTSDLLKSENQTRFRDLLTQVPVDFEPKLANRFIFDFPPHWNISPWATQAISSPRCTIIGYNQRVTWQPIQVEVIDTYARSISQSIMRQLETQAQGTYHTAPKAETFIVNVLDPTGCVVETWRIEGTVSAVQFAEYSYERGEPQKVTITIDPKYCLLERVQ